MHFGNRNLRTLIAFRKYMTSCGLQTLCNGPEAPSGGNLKVWPTNQRTYLLTGVGSRDGYASKNVTVLIFLIWWSCDSDEENFLYRSWLAANAYPAVTTGPRLLKILIARRDEYRDRDSDLLLPQQSSTVLGPSTSWQVTICTLVSRVQSLEISKLGN